MSATVFEPLHLAVDEDLAQGFGTMLRAALSELLTPRPSVLSELEPVTHVPAAFRVKKKTRPANVRRATAPVTPSKYDFHELSVAEVAEWNAERREWAESHQASPERSEGWIGGRTGWLK